jgi:cardiolipin synthase
MFDPRSARRFRLPGGKDAILVDTVWFIHDIPEELRQAFLATLEGIGEADLLLRGRRGADAASRQSSRSVGLSFRDSRSSRGEQAGPLPKGAAPQGAVRVSEKPGRIPGFCRSSKGDMSASGKDRFDQARLINIANGLTAMRVLLVPLFAYLLISGREWEALVVFGVCGVSDGLDGLLARWLRQRTLVGAFLDPIADKLLMAPLHRLASREDHPHGSRSSDQPGPVHPVGSSSTSFLLESTDIRPTGMSKVNTGVQILTVVYYLAIAAFPEAADSLGASDGTVVASVVLTVCALTTVLSGVQYLYLGIRKLSDA